jgi:uncharacterized protein (DUF1330 family)
MAAYMIVQIKITREEGWPEYRKQVSELFAQNGGRYLVRGGPVEVLEGSYDGRRLIVFEFPSMEVIRSVWHSPECAEVRKLREVRANWMSGLCLGLAVRSRPGKSLTQ